MYIDKLILNFKLMSRQGKEQVFLFGKIGKERKLNIVGEVVRTLATFFFLSVFLLLLLFANLLMSNYWWSVS